MIPNPGFSELPRPRVVVPDVEPQTYAVNDPVFKDALEMKLEKLSPEQLFLMRKSHEIQHSLGWRIAANVDTPIINRIREQMALRGIDEKEYTQFLKNRVQAD